MKGLESWRLLDELTISQASALVCNVDPICVQNGDAPDCYNPTAQAIADALYKGAIKGDIEPLDSPDFGKQKNGPPDVHWSTVEVGSLKDWLLARGIKGGFFFPDYTGVPSYLDPEHECYSPKLAAAVQAWEALVADPSLRRRKTVKTAASKWLEKNADKFDLKKGDRFNAQGIDDIAKVVNWNQKGGAPKSC